MSEYILRDPVLEQMMLNDATERRIVTIKTEIDRDEIYKAKYYLERIVRNDLKKGISHKDSEPITIRLDSYGGGVTATMYLIGYIRYLQSLGRIINTEACSVCMSGAFKILIAGSNRSAFEYCDIMVHQPNGYREGIYTHQDQKIDFERSIKTWQMLKDFIVENTKITNEQLDKYVNENRDWHMTASEAIELGVIDNIIGGK